MRVKSVADLHALHKAGAVKSVDGMRFVEPPKSEPSPQTSAQTTSLEPLIAEIRESMQKQTAVAQENTGALHGLISSVLRVLQKPQTQARPKRWEFIFERDEDGFTEKIIATAVYE